jgi:hypothetical protein
VLAGYEETRGVFVVKVMEDRVEEGDATIIVSTDMLPFTGVVKVLPVICLTKQEAELFISQSLKESIARPLLYVNSIKVDDPSMVGVLVVLKD